MMEKRIREKKENGTNNWERINNNNNEKEKKVLRRT